MKYMKKSIIVSYSKKSLLLCVFMTLQIYNGHSQMVIKETNPIYKSKSVFDYTIIPKATKIAKLYNVTAYPTNIIIDKNGIIKTVKVGIEENIKEKLNNDIAKLLKE